MMRVLELCGTVSNTRAMACIMVNPSLQRDFKCGWRHTTNSALLFVCVPGHLSDRFLAGEPNQPQREGREEGRKSYLGSFGPHHTPMPATAATVPFALHAPSEYTISAVVFLGAATHRG